MYRRLFLASFVLLFPFEVKAEMLNYPTVVLRTLDKSTARTDTREVNIGETIEFGSLFIKVQSCRKSEPLDKPESASFIQVWEVPINSKKSEWVFSGWMFASSPALSAIDHPIYDVWVLDCKGREEDAPKTNSVKIGGEAVPIIRETATPEDDETQESVAEETETQLLNEPEESIEQESIDMEPVPVIQNEEESLKDSVESLIDRVTTDQEQPEEVIYE